MGSEGKAAVKSAKSWLPPILGALGLLLAIFLVVGSMFGPSRERERLRAENELRSTFEQIVYHDEPQATAIARLRARYDVEVKAKPGGFEVEAAVTERGAPSRSALEPVVQGLIRFRNQKPVRWMVYVKGVAL